MLIAAAISVCLKCLCCCLLPAELQEKPADSGAGINGGVEQLSQVRSQPFRGEAHTIPG